MANEGIEKVPVTGSGAAQSLRPVSAASSVSSRAASGSDVGRLTTGRARLEYFHFGCAPSASHPVGCGVSLHEARCPAAHIPRRDHPEICGVGVQGHTRSEREMKRPGNLCGIRASGNQSAAVASFRRGGLPERGNPRTRDGQAPAPSADHWTPARRHARTRTGRRGLGRCEWRSGCSRWGSWYQFRSKCRGSSKNPGAALRAKSHRTFKRQDAV